MTVRFKETEVARLAVAWLEEQGWDAYQEVKGPTDHIADIVATRGGLVAVVECKAALCPKVCVQAQRWAHYADFRWVCVDAEPRDPDARWFYRDWLRDHGIGLLRRCQWDTNKVSDSVGTSPPLRPRVSDDLLNALRPEHKTYAAAGSPSGRSFSPFKETCVKVRAYLLEHPGSSAADVVRAFGRLHYKTEATARSSLLSRAKRGILEGVRVDEQDGKYRLYAAGEGDV